MADNKGNELKPMDFDCLIISQMKLARLDLVVVVFWLTVAILFVFISSSKTFLFCERT